MLQESNSHHPAKKLANFFDVYLLGITIVIAGQAISWNYAMQCGFVEFLISTLIIGFGYFSLVFCVGEMISALPFSGGLYGLARVALNPFAGFIVGIFEIVHNIFTITSATIPLAAALTETIGTPYEIEPVYWVIILGMSLIINCIGGNTFWLTNRILSIGSLLIFLFYFITPIVNPTDFYKNALVDYSGERDHHFNLYKFFEFMPLAVWWFLGIELLPFACVHTPNPKTTIPWAMILGLFTLILLSILVYFAAAAQAPGVPELSNALIPLSYGFANMLKISSKQANWLSFPMLFSPILGFLFGGGRQIWSMSSSGLLPSILRLSIEETQTPYVALILECIIAFVAMLITRYCLGNNTMIHFYLYVLGSSSVYILTFCAFISFNNKYPTLKRSFVNPLGNAGAYVGIIIFLLLFASILGLQKDPDVIVAPISFAFVIIVGALYYYLYAKKRQYYSQEEQKAFFITYVINANSKGRKKTNRSFAPSVNRSNPSSARPGQNNSISVHTSHSQGSRESSIHLENNDGIIDFDALPTEELMAKFNKRHPNLDIDKIIDPNNGSSKKEFKSTIRIKKVVPMNKEHVYEAQEEGEAEKEQEFEDIIKNENFPNTFQIIDTIISEPSYLEQNEPSNDCNC